MNNPIPRLKVTAIQDDSGNYTAFINQFPGLVVQGSSKDDVSRKLDLLLDNFIKKLEESRNNLEIETKNLA